MNADLRRAFPAPVTRIACLLIGMAGPLFLASCRQTVTSHSPQVAGAYHPSPATSRALESAETKRTGLATGWGETRDSVVTSRAFSRGSRPHGTGRLYYNDEAGAKAMSTGSWHTARQPDYLAGGTVAVGLQSTGGAYLPSYRTGNKRVYVGENGSRYRISLKNLTPSRIEVVVSVDGLDVMDGQAASTSKRGYLIGPHGDLHISGFRKSQSSVAAFRFSSVEDSYANRKHGSTDNVGVIGVAVFTEGGRDPFRGDEAARRQDANPFPGRFATAP